MIITIWEIIDIIVMTFIIGYLFKDTFIIRKTNYEGVPIKEKWYDGLQWAMIATAPAIILHEMGHKILATSFGLNATFHAAYFWLAIGLIIKLIKLPFPFLIPAYVEIIGQGTNMQFAIISIAGPLINLILWLVSMLLLKFDKNIKGQWKIILLITKRINGFLFLINMLPLPGFDGFQFYQGIYQSLL